MTTRAARTFIPKTSAAPDAHLREAKGDFTVKAHLREKYMALSDQPGSYGPAIAAETTESGATP